MAPTLIASYPVYVLSQSAADIVSPSFTPSNGEIVVVKLSTWDTGSAMGTPSGGAQTYAPDQVSAPGGFNQWAGVFTTKITGSPGAMTISSTPASTSVHSMIVERWGNAQLAATPASCSPINGSGTPSSTVTTTAPNSVVSWVSGDAQSRDPATRAYLSSATEDGLQDGHAGFNGVAYFAWQAAATAGAQTVGLSAPGSQAWVVAGIEIQAASGGSSVTADDTAPAADTASRSQSLSRTAADGAAASDTATRSTSSSRTTSDTAAATDSATRTSGSSRSSADSAAAADTAARTTSTTRSTSDTAAASDTATSSTTIVRTAADTAPAADTVTRTIHASRTATDSAPAADTATIPHTSPINAVFEFGGVLTRWTMQGALPMPLTISSLSTEYVEVFVRSTVHGYPHDPSADTVAMAFIPDSRDPGPSDWHTGSWDTIGANRWVAQCLVGPAAGGVPLAAGGYAIWVRVTDNPEVPVEQVGQLVIV